MSSFICSSIFEIFLFVLRQTNKNLRFPHTLFFIPPNGTIFSSNLCNKHGRFNFYYQSLDFRVSLAILITTEYYLRFFNVPLPPFPPTPLRFFSFCNPTLPPRLNITSSSSPFQRKRF